MNFYFLKKKCIETFSTSLIFLSVIRKSVIIITPTIILQLLLKAQFEYFVFAEKNSFWACVRTAQKTG